MDAEEAERKPQKKRAGGEDKPRRRRKKKEQPAGGPTDKFQSTFRKVDESLSNDSKILVGKLILIVIMGSVIYVQWEGWDVYTKFMGS